MSFPLEISPDVEFLRDVKYGVAGGHPLLADLAKPRDAGNSPLPAIVYFHGGAWQSGSKSDGIPAICFLAQHGFVAVSVGYRLSGEARFPAQIEDCKCAVRFLRTHAKEYGIDPDRIGAMGVSSGAHLAILLGLTGDGPQFANRGGWEEASSRVSAVCDLFAPTDFLRMPAKHLPDAMSATARFLGGGIDEVMDRYIAASPVNYVHPSAPPFLIVHGELDPLVPILQSELLRHALENAGADVTFHVVTGAGHGSREVITPAVRDLIVSFFDKHLRRQRT